MPVIGLTANGGGAATLSPTLSIVEAQGEQAVALNLALNCAPIKFEAITDGKLRLDEIQMDIKKVALKFRTALRPDAVDPIVLPVTTVPLTFNLQQELDGPSQHPEGKRSVVVRLKKPYLTTRFADISAANDIKGFLIKGKLSIIGDDHMPNTEASDKALKELREKAAKRWKETHKAIKCSDEIIFDAFKIGDLEIGRHSVAWKAIEEGVRIWEGVKRTGGDLVKAAEEFKTRVNKAFKIKL
jgi:hypothetical protein